MGALIQELSPLSQQLIQGFGIPEQFLGPVAADWEKYNKVRQSDLRKSQIVVAVHCIACQLAWCTGRRQHIAFTAGLKCLQHWRCSMSGKGH